MPFLCLVISPRTSVVTSVLVVPTSIHSFSPRVSRLQLPLLTGYGPRTNSIDDLSRHSDFRPCSLLFAVPPLLRLLSAFTYIWTFNTNFSSHHRLCSPLLLYLCQHTIFLFTHRSTLQLLYCNFVAAVLSLSLHIKHYGLFTVHLLSLCQPSRES
jgi:hypothetical protein